MNEQPRKRESKKVDRKHKNEKRERNTISNLVLGLKNNIYSHDSIRSYVSCGSVQRTALIWGEQLAWRTFPTQCWRWAWIQLPDEGGWEWNCDKTELIETSHEPMIGCDEFWWYVTTVVKVGRIRLWRVDKNLVNKDMDSDIDASRLPFDWIKIFILRENFDRSKG